MPVQSLWAITVGFLSSHSQQICMHGRRDGCEDVIVRARGGGILELLFATRGERGN